MEMCTFDTLQLTNAAGKKFQLNREPTWYTSDSKQQLKALTRPENPPTPFPCDILAHSLMMLRLEQSS